MKEKFAKFMQGRYGADSLSRFMVTVGFILLLLNLFLNSKIVAAVIMVILVGCYYRMFSRDYHKRYEENVKFLTLRSRLLYKLSGKKNEVDMLKDYHIYRCPSCKQKIRIPRRKGKIIVTCPKCKTEFQKRS